MAYLAHVGDCRVYHVRQTQVRQTQVRQLTRDHSWSRELGVLRLLWRLGRAGPPSRHILSRALGDQPIVRVDVAQLAAHPGDRFILCSDGVWGSIGPSDFTALAILDMDDHTLAQSLTAAALARGGTDDATAAVVSVQRVTEQLESCLGSVATRYALRGLQGALPGAPIASWPAAASATKGA